MMLELQINGTFSGRKVNELDFLNRRDLVDLCNIL